MFLGSPEEDTVAVKSSEFLEEPGEKLKDKLMGKKRHSFLHPLLVRCVMAFKSTHQRF